MSALTDFYLPSRQYQAQRHPSSAGLTDADDRLLRRVAEGATAKELAVEYGMNARAMRSWLDRIRKKLGAVNTVHAVWLWSQRG